MAAEVNRPDPTSFKVTALLTGLVAFGPVSTDLYLASLPDMGRYFGTSVEMVQMTLSVFLLGFAVAMLIYGPLSDRFGRRRVILGGVVIYVVGSLACMVAPTIEALIASRFLQAVGACCGPVVSRAVVRDVYPREQAAKVMSYMASAMALAPFVAPLLGGWFHTLFGWRSNFILLLLFGLILLAGTWRWLGETNSHPDPHALSPLRMAGNYRTLLADRQVLGYVAVVSTTFAGMFSFISGSSFVLIDVLGLPPAYFGFGFAVVVAGYMVGGFVAGKWTQRVGLDRMIGFGVAGVAVTGGVCMTLAWMGVQSLPALLLPLMFFFMAGATVIPNGSAGAIASHPRMAGAASALLGFVQMVSGSVAGWIHSTSFDHSTRPLATLTGCMGLAALAAYWLLVKRRDQAA
ncbi:multidrug effflux MFS transporter [Magnetospirillum sp. 64-120]|uniref:multidrug effflux MFS transporter n=1 Tax=Magnetospirillum sp. 64-120 TaxID=1895778 RepID=UPI00092C800B|nr:multidrug effflux MFS transporter [Magnetospirillum sp. 64-120]OJX81818.1 MAG: Bcr/CflA family drug resistance efflux transporter [Magnetospirillum sp. 64-120]